MMIRSTSSSPSAQAHIDDTRDDVSFNVYNVNPDTNPGAEPVAHV